MKINDLDAYIPSTRITVPDSRLNGPSSTIWRPPTDKSWIGMYLPMKFDNWLPRYVYLTLVSSTGPLSDESFFAAIASTDIVQMDRLPV